LLLRPQRVYCFHKRAMSRAFLLSMLPALASSVVPGACEAGGCDEEQAALLQLASERGWQQQRPPRVGPLDGQRPDDPSTPEPVPVPEVETPPPFEETLEFQGVHPHLDWYNPLDRPLVSNHTPPNCREETWPMFKVMDGKWTGDKGLNFITLPQLGARGAPPGTPPPAALTKKFLVIVNRYEEELEFTPLKAPVLNRGYMNGIMDDPKNQSDQVLTGVLYMQTIKDLDLGATIHEENGIYLHQSCRPANAFVGEPWQVMRLGSVPHGSQEMGYGNLTAIKTPTPNYYMQMLLRLRKTYEFSVIPIVPGCGPEREQRQFMEFPVRGRQPPRPTGPLSGTSDIDCCISNTFYMSGIDACPLRGDKAPGCPEPLDMLIEEVRGLNVIEYHQINMSTADSIMRHQKGRWEPALQGGGIQNSAFVNIASLAVSESFKNLVWLLTVQCEDGSTYQLIQYIQTMNLNFLPIEAGCPNVMWPHVDANTLRRVGPLGQQPSCGKGGPRV